MLPMIMVRYPYMERGKRDTKRDKRRPENYRDEMRESVAEIDA
jgi:hypothetical protein